MARNKLSVLFDSPHQKSISYPLTARGSRHMKCPKCQTHNPDAKKFCGECATPLTGTGQAQPSFTKTIGTTEEEKSPASSDLGPPSQSSMAHGRFFPGAMVADRYRIVGLLGKGGMGEVYRADDLKLGQAVALKFLPPQFSRDPKRLEYFHNEVRLARQITHPNVCRVHDIGEVDGQQFLSMEYVDGEDLATLIRRIGRLPQDKGLDIARQLCAGLAASHDRGVLHRDLKPANVMLDGRGQVRITDFGVARMSAKQEGPETGVGTPAYMAPEQLDDRQVTEQSDIYSLGLILFEVFTGKAAYAADNLPGLLKQRERSVPVVPSTFVPDIDPAVEQVIQRCLERQPQDRPQSALAVAAMLPGGDPLAAALAAGETPSPEMVAAAGESGYLRPWIAICWLIALMLGLVAAAFLADKATVLGNAGLSERPDALDKVARDIVHNLGYLPIPKDRAYGFQYDADYLWALRTEGIKSRHNERPGIYFWYRQSPYHLIPLERHVWIVSEDDPPPTLPGMVGVRLKGNGDLIEFYAVHQKNSREGNASESAGWERLFEWAGLDPERFVERSDEDLMGSPVVLADRQYIWEGSSPAHQNDLRVEAAAYRTRPVYFRIFESPPPPQMNPMGIPPSDRQPLRIEKTRVVEWTLMIIVLVGAALAARRSVRLGRSDRKGSFRLGLFIFSFNLLAWFFEASHVPFFAGELGLVLSGVSTAMFYGVYFGLVYLAFEPYIRRFWPTLLISWNRLLSGRFRDPSVGRDLLVGATVGVWFWPVQEFLTVLAPDWLGPVHPFWRMLPNTLLGGRHLPAVSLFCLSAIGVSLVYLLALILLRIILRKWWLWAPAFVAQGAFFFILSDVTSIARWIMVATLMIASLLLYTRLGLLAAVAFFFAAYILTDFPLTAHINAWYWSSSLYALGIVAALGTYGFFTCTTNRPLVRSEAAFPQST